MAATVAEAENRARSAARATYQNSAAYKIPELLRGTEYAFREVILFNSFTRGACGMEFAPGFAGMDDSITAGGRAFAFGDIALAMAPMFRAGGFADDFVRVGAKGGEKFSQTFGSFDDYWRASNSQARIDALVEQYGLAKHASGKQIVYGGERKCGSQPQRPCQSGMK